MSPLGTPLNQEAMNLALRNGYWRVHVSQQTGSTQHDLTAAIRTGKAEHGAVYVTEFQSAGRGRMDRKFEAPAGSSLLFSAHVVPKNSASQWGWLPLLAGQAVVAALEMSLGAGANLELKWPNDIWLNQKKIAGLLAERLDDASAPGVVFGIGINVHTGRQELPFENASSLAIEGWTGIDRNRLLVEILTRLSIYLARWEEGDPSLLPEYLSRSATVGASVRIETPGGRIIESIAADVDASGALVLADGELVTVGDVVHLYLN